MPHTGDYGRSILTKKRSPKKNASAESGKRTKKSRTIIGGRRGG